MKKRMTLDYVRQWESSDHNRDVRKSSLWWLDTYGNRGTYLTSRTTGVICGHSSSRAKMLDDFETEVFVEYEILTALQYRRKWEGIVG